MMQDPDELLRQAIYEQSQRGSHYPSSFNNFPGPLPPIPEDMNASTEDDYEIYVLDGKIRARPKVQKKEIFIGPGGKQLPEDVQEQIRGYGSEDEVSNALYDDLFRMASGKSEFSNEALDKKKQMTDYLNNDQRLIESLIRRGKIKA